MDLPLIKKALQWRLEQLELQQAARDPAKLPGERYLGHMAQLRLLAEILDRGDRAAILENARRLAALLVVYPDLVHGTGVLQQALKEWELLGFTHVRVEPSGVFDDYVTGRDLYES